MHEINRRSPIEWETPSGQMARVNLQMQFSSFFGYVEADTDMGYLGPQCHGCLWPVNDADLPHYWPIAPPIVSGKVRTHVAPTFNASAPLLA
jgi:hypothetical protein